MYKWEKIGNQEFQLKQRCTFGPIILEVRECGWTEEDKCLAIINVKQWQPEIHKYKSILLKRDIPWESAHKMLEEWYAKNILIDKIVLG